MCGNKPELVRIALLLIFTTGLFSCAEAQWRKKKAKVNETPPFAIEFENYSPNYVQEPLDANLETLNLGDTLYLMSDTSFMVNTYLKDTLDKILDSLAVINHMVPFRGYRIVLYTGPDRQKAVITKGKAIKLLGPETEIYFSYNQPYFRVKAGNYYDRRSAFPTFNRIKRTFPTALLVPETINKDKIQFE